ncbi:ubiquitin C-terminal hydrolase-like protein [Corynespora cassiicola Philippines]|uniref:Ubiquitin C-terminal hydrolase-like protein n=1 Tax=Corynespora cassiicola Philippines TaxID=1448308 RepID=A0A2T2P896_CORCC|nr:ubiquitin C-terminal hydrolase-like protein [Corynespora cassiicola Philippines]
MSQRDHGLMEPVAADDQAITAVPVPVPAPASSPRRGSMEDADPYSTRKRPRLDDGSMDNRDLSAEPHTQAQLSEQLEMTIRSQPPSSSLADHGDAVDTPSVPDSPAARDSSVPVSATDLVVVDDEDAPADSPPVIAVDSDSDSGIGNFSGIEMDYDDEAYFRRFPFTQFNDMDPLMALRTITQHFHGAQALDGTVLPQIALWLDNIPNQSSLRWRGLFLERSQFWDEFATFLNKILGRRYPFGDTFCDDTQTEEDIFYNFFRSYLVLCSSLLQVDAELLSRAEGTYELPLLCNKHLRHLFMLLRSEKSPVFHILAKEYGAATSEMGDRLMCDFIRAGGVQHLLQFAEAAYNKVSVSMQGWIATWVTQTLSTVGWFVIDIRDDELIDRRRFYRDVLQYFRTYTKDMDKPSKDVDIGVFRDLILFFTNLLSELCSWDTFIAAQLATEFLDFRDPESPASTTSEGNREAIGYERFCRDPNNYAALVTNAWKFKLLRKYIVKGRMDFRVMSIGTMDASLVDIWREYSATGAGVNHPVMQYLAEFLLHERVVDYIISVDSHPQLISRSGNIVGFLVVTHRYSTLQTDAIWNTVCHCQDHRVVSATMTMIRGIIGLMEAPELLYLCSKLYELPIETYSLDLVRFLRELTGKLQPKYICWPETELSARPWNVCVRILQDSSPGKESTPNMAMLHAEACEQLRQLAVVVSTEERHRIFSECDALIASRSTKSTGCIRAMFVLASAVQGDSNFFIHNSDVTRHLIEETCHFVDIESKAGFSPSTVAALQCRLDMICMLICRAFDAIPVDLYETTWDHLVGKNTQTRHQRDLAWSKFSEAARLSPKSDFCQQLISSYVPKLEPQFYTKGFFDFVAAYRFPTVQEEITEGQEERTLPQIRGADLLWSILLSAPHQSIEDSCARLLATRYLEVDIAQDITVEQVESIHVALVEERIQRLLSAYKTLRNKAAEPDAADDTMDISLSDTSRQQTELHFTRTILFLKIMLMQIRNRPEFCRSRRTDSKIEVLDDVPFGNEIEIPYQYQAATKQEKGSVSMNSDHTLEDLHRRLCFVTGFSKINLFAKGQRWNIAEKGIQKLIDLGLNGMLVTVQKAPGSEETYPVVEYSSNCSVFEATLLNHWEELFACMDSDDQVSSVLFEFLGCFPIRERFAESVMAGTASADDLFPPGKVFQAKYALVGLQSKLREQLRRSSLDETYLANAVQLLDKALRNPALLSHSLSNNFELHLAAHLVVVLLEFLKAERPGSETSSCYFADVTSLVNRLVSILFVAIKNEPDSSAIVTNCYATILEASLHSHAVWEAFMNSPQVVPLHEVLLLLDPRKNIRENTAQSIASVCGGDLPSTSPLNRAETASRFWSILSTILPGAAKYPEASKQLFEISEHVFRVHDEYSRDEVSLRQYLANWSDLLLQYKHQEVVGRDDVDFVVMGFTKLLLCCIPSLKSFKKPLNSGSLMEQVFTKFLFVPKVIEVDGAGSEDVSLPVLESKTRKELYDLVLALAEDQSSYNTLLRLVANLSDDDIGGQEIDRPMYTIDRSNEIRSATGYVGLVNPRAICYMNSLLTQLFMNLNFRKFMLGLNVADSQRLLQETQKLFAQMQNTYRKATDPRAFAACVKGLQDAPIDINVQMDADEFYNLLFDQWEGQMLSPEIKQQFRSFYGGQTVNQIKSKECGHVSERVESFFVVQCDVKDKKDLQESLQSFVEGDVMEGENKYKCESCGGKFVDAVKRTCLKEVPDNLIFHLKRFDFDLVEMRRSKINDRFEFPSVIDISPYHVDHLSDPSNPRQEDIFELVGVLVHQGTSENGHYYSYIRERPGTADGGSKWVEFNDRDVDPFDPMSIPQNAFGGTYENEFSRQYKAFSAYMLFYQRKSSIDKNHREFMVPTQCITPKVPIPSSLEKEIKEDNEFLIKEYSLCDPNHSKFVRQALTTLRTVNHGTCSEEHQQEAQALHAMLEHLSRTICRLRTADNFEETMAQLRKSALGCFSCCHIVLSWMAHQPHALVNLLLRCYHAKIRAQVRAFLIDGLQYLRDKDPASYGIENPDTDMETGGSAPSRGVLVQITHRLKLVAEESGISSRGWDDLYLTIGTIVTMGRIETATVLNQRMLDFCLQVLCMHALPPLRDNHRPDLWRMVEKKKGIYNRMVELVLVLLDNMDIRLPIVADPDADRLEHFDRASAKFPLSMRERQLMEYWHEDNKAIAVLDKMIEMFDVSKNTVFYPGQVLKWMLQSEDPVMQEQLFITVLEGIHMLTPPSSDPYVRAALPFCEACTDAEHVGRIVDMVVKTTLNLREAGGEVRLQFFSGLLLAENDAVFEQRDAEIFYLWTLQAMRKCAIPLLLYDDDGIRKATEVFLCREVFSRPKPNETISDVLMRTKYKIIRALANEMNRKVIDEHNAAISRSYMQPMISTLHALVTLLNQLLISDDPVMDSYKHVNDAIIIQQFQEEVNPRLTIWPFEEGTPISTGDTYEQSDYGSESDEGPDMLEL